MHDKILLTDQVERLAPRDHLLSFLRAGEAVIVSDCENTEIST